MTTTSHLQIPQENAVVKSHVARRVAGVLSGAPKGEFFDIKVGEFDDVYYNVKAEKSVPNIVTLSMSLPTTVDLPQVRPGTPNHHSTFQEKSPVY